MISQRLILAVRRRSLPDALAGSGFHSLHGEDIVRILSAAGLWLGPRAELEIDDSFRQLIPYIVLARRADVISYRRTAVGGEQRLHGRLSLGVGGHIDLGDVVAHGEQIDLERTLLTAAQREITEEIGTVEIVDRQWIGVLVDDDSPVGRVHLGVVGLWTIADAIVRAAEDALHEVQQVPIGGLRAEDPRLEIWSAMLVPHLASLGGNTR